MGATGFKVGELARRIGLTVRTLHYYDEIGLLRPSQHTATGHRLYTARDVERLHQIASLRRLGLSLDEVRACLSRPDCSLQHTIELHLARLEEQIAREQALYARLLTLADGLRAAGEVSVEQLMQTLEVMAKVEKYCTPQQMEQIKRRREEYGEERIRQAEAEWADLIAQVEAEMERGTDPTSERVRALAARWQDLVNQFTAGDPGIEQSLRRMWQE